MFSQYGSAPSSEGASLNIWLKLEARQQYIYLLLPILGGKKLWTLVLALLVHITILLSAYEGAAWLNTVWVMHWFGLSSR